MNIRTDLYDDTTALEIAKAIDTIARDIIRQASLRYPPGHPVRDLPSIATTIEYQLKRRRVDDARTRAEQLQKYFSSYEPITPHARDAKKRIVQRMRDIVTFAL